MSHSSHSSRPIRLASLLMAGALSVIAATRADALTVSVSPADTTVGIGDTFLIRVAVDEVADLKAFQLIHRCAPATLHYEGSIAGEVLTGAGLAYTVFDRADVVAPTDSVWVDCARLDGTAQGPGNLVYYRFHAVREGDSPIECLQADLRDSHNVPLLPACVGGMVHVIGPTPTVPRSWGRLKALYR